jgi:hypothetical protein
VHIGVPTPPPLRLSSTAVATTHAVRALQPRERKPETHGFDGWQQGVRADRREHAVTAAVQQRVVGPDGDASEDHDEACLLPVLAGECNGDADADGHWRWQSSEAGKSEKRGVPQWVVLLVPAAKGTRAMYFIHAGCKRHITPQGAGVATGPVKFVVGALRRLDWAAATFEPVFVAGRCSCCCCPAPAPLRCSGFQCSI